MLPSIRTYLNYGQMAALVVIERDSRILTLTGLSLGIMRLVEIPHTVLVQRLSVKKESNALYFILKCILFKWENESSH